MLRSSIRRLLQCKRSTASLFVPWVRDNLPQGPRQPDFVSGLCSDVVLLCSRRGHHGAYHCHWSVGPSQRPGLQPQALRPHRTSSCRLRAHQLPRQPARSATGTHCPPYTPADCTLYLQCWLTIAIVNVSSGWPLVKPEQQVAGCIGQVVAHKVVMLTTMPGSPVLM